jgi:hypothetical protein
MIWGVWQVVDYTATDPVTHVVQHPFGEKPLGSAIYTKKGHVSVFVSGSQRKSADGRAQLLDSMYAYTGTYVLKGNEVTIHVESAWQPDWIGSDRTRTIKIQNNVMTVTTAPMTSPVDGKTYISITVFKRVE